MIDGTMIRRTLVAAAAVFLLAHSTGASADAENTAQGAKIIYSSQAPLTKGATSISLDVSPNAQIGQFAIANVITFGGSEPTITPPDGWQLIRDDSTPTTRQSLYSHEIEANDSNAASWTFSEPVDAQGAIVLLDNVASDSPVDASSGNTGGVGGGVLTAKSVTTTGSGDLILAFNATDFGAYRGTVCENCSGLYPALPQNASVVLNQESTPQEYWIMQNYQTGTGPTPLQISVAPQLFYWVSAQVAIKAAD
jgi:hypothetical protein